MQPHDEDLELYLKKFQPRTIRRLDVRRQTGNSWLRRMAAVVVFAGIISLWYAQRKTVKPPEKFTIQAVRSIRNMPQTHMSTPVLTKLALDDSKAFDALLTNESRTVLPSMQGEQSALRVLAND
jgi:hypothetical protein